MNWKCKIGLHQWDYGINYYKVGKLIIGRKTRLCSCCGKSQEFKPCAPYYSLISSNYKWVDVTEKINTIVY